MNWWLNIFFENDSIKMVFSIDLKIIKIDLDHLSKLEIIKSRIICPEGKDHDFSKMHLFFGLQEKLIIFLEFVIIRSLDEITFFFWEIWDLSDFGYYKRSSKSSISYLRVIQMDLNFQYFMVCFEIWNFTVWTVRNRT